MYRCRECKAEYNQKVDYCDCGNNTFDIIDDAPFTEEKQSPINVKTPKDSISLAFFVICLILSIIVWLIPVKSAPHKPEAQKSVQKPKTVNIPNNIDKIWDDTPLYAPKQEQQPEVINEERQVPIPLTSTPVDYARRITETPAPEKINNMFKKRKQYKKLNKRPRLFTLQKQSRRTKNLSRFFMSLQNPFITPTALKC